MKIENYWTKRQTVRNFSDKEILEELLCSLLEKASFAPTTGNMQLYSVVVTKDLENRKNWRHFISISRHLYLLLYC